jgi:hypothetical protein
LCATQTIGSNVDPQGQFLGSAPHGFNSWTAENIVSSNQEQSNCENREPKEIESECEENCDIECWDDLCAQKCVSSCFFKACEMESVENKFEARVQKYVNRSINNTVLFIFKSYIILSLVLGTTPVYSAFQINPQ